MENLFTSVPEEVPGKIAQSLGASQQTLRDNPRQSVSNQGLEGRDLPFFESTAYSFLQFEEYRKSYKMTMGKSGRSFFGNFCMSLTS